MKNKLFFFKKPLIYLITENRITTQNFISESKKTLEIIKAAVETGVSLVQLREKQLPAKLIFELAQSAAKITAKSKTKLLINDRADIALAAQADGVHLTSTSIPTEIIRRNVPENFIIGVSAHSLAKAKEAKKQNADFAAFSPIFNSPGKDNIKGLNELQEVCKALKPFPIIALGGVDEKNYREVLKIADGFAAIRFLNDAANLRKLNGELL